MKTFYSRGAARKWARSMGSAITHVKIERRYVVSFRRRSHGPLADVHSDRMRELAS